MPEPQEVFICPSCRKFLPVDEAEDDKPVCRTEDCDRQGEILNRMWMCPACQKCFDSKQQLKKHGQEAHQ
ncbi:MAG: hypothetical protein SV186_02285 [Candidatus Nanohaloarchaea archaeon]|nr:hypothetical protein [Candidatus Nanohaloarchaea archaeon]